MASLKNYCYLNESFLPLDEAKLAITDRGLLLADGFFTTLLSHHNHLIFFEDHWQRLLKSSKLLNIPLPFTQQQLKTICHQLNDYNHFGKTTASFRITITRGVGPRGVLPPANLQPSCFILAFPLSSFPNSITLIPNTDFRVCANPLSSIKTLNYSEKIYAKQQGAALGFDDILFLNFQNEICNTSCANIFMVFSQKLYTPPISSGIIEGILRKNILKIATKLGIAFVESPIQLNQVTEADEIFVTNSLVGIQGVSKIESISLTLSANTAITEALKEHYQLILHSP